MKSNTIPFKYKPIDYFEESDYYDIHWTLLNNKTWSNLEWFDITQKGEKEFGIFYLPTDIKYDIIAHENELHYGANPNNIFGQWIYGESYSKLTFYPIPLEMIEKIYTKDENPEYYL